ncbi:15910_t:CDS:1, partial [Funneliformis geosporum]
CSSLLMIDMDKYLIIKNSIHRGMIIISYRYSKANNLQYPDYNPSKLNFWIIYKNMNALYSGAITQYIHTKILNKMNPKEVPNVQSIMSDTEIDYMFKIDLEALIHLYNFFTDYPLTPKKQVVPKNSLAYIMKD